MASQKQCSQCKNGSAESNFMHFCSALWHYVVTNRVNKIINKVEHCRAEELGKGVFEKDIERT